MSRSITGAFAGWSARRRRWAIVAVASTTVAAAGATLLVGGGGTALAGQTGSGAAVTRAGLDPALVAGRGADVAFLEQEAENAATNGTVIGPDRDRVHACRPRRRAASAVKLTPGQYVEFTLPADGQRDHRALQHPGRAQRRRHHRAARRDGQRRQRAGR